MAKLLILYLFAYNSLQAASWTISLLKILSSVYLTSSTDGAYATSGDLIALLQVTSFVEVLHGALGIVPSGVVSPLMQWCGRTHFLLAVVRQILEVQELPAVFITFVAWCLSDIIRYPHYATNCVGTSPSWLTYIRYTAFIVLYPIGLTGEMWIMYQALPYIKKVNLYANLFAGLPISYYDLIRVLLILYPLLWLRLYLPLFKQRRSKLGGHHGKRKTG